MIQPAIVRGVRVSDEMITMMLEDGRELSAPTAWSQRLRGASEAARAHVVIDEDGMVVAWPEVDEHIGVWTLLGVSEEDVFAAAGLTLASR